MPRVKSPEREDHHERATRALIWTGVDARASTGELLSIEIRAAQIKATLRTFQLAAMIHELSGAVWAKAGSVLQARLLRH
jgi:hypothetical protein